MTVACLLKNKKVYIMTDVRRWANWFERSGEKRRVGVDEIGDVKISTIFLGMDHGFGEKPLWFETMVFGGDRDGECIRYETYEEAEIGHKKLVEELSK